MRWGLFFIFNVLAYALSFAQLQFSDTDLDMGVVESAYELKASITLTNTSSKTIFLLRADTEPEVTVQAQSKKLLAGDTTTVLLSYRLKKAGKFSTRIQLISTAQNQAYIVTWRGQVKNWKADDKTACFYFKKPIKTATSKPEINLAGNTTTSPKDNSNKIPDVTSEPVVSYTPEPKPKPNLENELEPDDLPLLLYKPNNLVFLVDVSSSMKDSLKLPLMKLALYKLVAALREVDAVSFMTYADSVKVIAEHISGGDKATLNKAISAIKARGLTKGNKAILASVDLTLRHYLPEGNNQIILATDGEFRMTPEDYKKWKDRTQAKTMVLSTVGFGTDKKAIANLKTIAKNGSGSFIQVTSKKGAAQILIDEIKSKSKR